VPPGGQISPLPEDTLPHTWRFSAARSLGKT
jgi:hypothetical protein